MFKQSLIFFIEKRFFYIFMMVYGLIATIFIYSVFHSVDKKLI